MIVERPKSRREVLGNQQRFHTFCNDKLTRVMNVSGTLVLTNRIRFAALLKAIRRSE